MTTTPILKLDHLGVTFPNHPVFTDLNLTIHQGEFWSIVGKNGVGKTTLMRSCTNCGQHTDRCNTYRIPRMSRSGMFPNFVTSMPIIR